MFKNLFSRKSDDSVTFNAKEFVLFWMVAAYESGIPGDISGHQLDLFGKANGIDFEPIVLSFVEHDFVEAQARFGAAIARHEEK